MELFYSLIKMYLSGKKEKQKIEEIIQCPKCGSTHLLRDYSRGELICNDCGLVIEEDFIDHNPEWPKRWLNFDKRIKRLHKYKG